MNLCKCYKSLLIFCTRKIIFLKMKIHVTSVSVVSIKYFFHLHTHKLSSVYGNISGSTAAGLHPSNKEIFFLSFLF